MSKASFQPTASLAALAAYGAASEFVAFAQVSNAGRYIWNSTSTASADGVSIVEATGVLTGRWLRLEGDGLSLAAYLGSGNTIARCDTDAATAGISGVLDTRATLSGDLTLTAAWTNLGGQFVPNGHTLSVPDTIVSGRSSPLFDFSGGGSVLSAGNAPASKFSFQNFGITSDSTGANVTLNSTGLSAIETYALSATNGIAGVSGPISVDIPAGFYAFTGVTFASDRLKFCGDGKAASWLLNTSATETSITFAPKVGNAVFSDSLFSDIAFANTITRTSPATSCFNFTYGQRVHYSNILFTGRLPSATGNTGDLTSFRSAIETTWTDCTWEGGAPDTIQAGVAETVIDEAQVDTFVHLGCTWNTYSIGAMYACKAGTSPGGIQTAQFVGCKTVGYQGGAGSWVGANDALAFVTVNGAVTNSTTIVTADIAAGYGIGIMKVGRPVYIVDATKNSFRGTSGDVNFAFIAAINTGTNTLTLDRPITAANGAYLLSGITGHVLGNCTAFGYSGFQFEGKDIGVFSPGGVGLRFSEVTLGGNVTRPIVQVGNFWSMIIENCTGTYGGTPLSSAVKAMVTLLPAQSGPNSANNKIVFRDNNLSTSGSYVDTNGIPLVVNLSGANVRAEIHSRVAGDQWGYFGTSADFNTYATFVPDLALIDAKVGFHGVTPVVQATRAGQITDNTGGIASTTFAAIAAGAAYAQSDMVAVKNALASIASQYNKIDTILHNLGLET